MRKIELSSSLVDCKGRGNPRGPIRKVLDREASFLIPQAIKHQRSVKLFGSFTG